MSERVTRTPNNIEYRLSDEDRTKLEGIINTNDYSALAELVKLPLDDMKMAYMQYVARYSVREGLEFIDTLLYDKNNSIAMDILVCSRNNHHDVFSIRCDKCGSNSRQYSIDSVDDVREMVIRAKWSYEQLEDGTDFDKCPICIRQEKKRMKT